MSDDAVLRVWNQPDPAGVYVVAGHPSWSSSPDAAQFVAQVWRVWPDHMLQVAEYAADSGAMYQFAWVLLHLAGAYRTQIPCYFILEVGATGYRVLEEIQLLERYGYGLSQKGRGEIQDFLSSVRHYYYFRPDNLFSRTAPIEWKTHGNNRPWILHGLRDTIERGHMTIRSPELIEELAALRRGEQGDNDQILGASRSSDARVMCAALAVECWMRAAMPDLENLLAPRELSTTQAKTVEQKVVQDYLGGILTRGRP